MNVEVLEKLTTSYKLEVSKIEEYKEDQNTVLHNKPNIFKKIGFILCGINLKEYDLRRKKLNEIPEKLIVDTSIDETPIWSTVCNICAILTISASGFVFSFFNKFN